MAIPSFHPATSVEGDLRAALSHAPAPTGRVIRRVADDGDEWLRLEETDDGTTVVVLTGVGTYVVGADRSVITVHPAPASVGTEVWEALLEVVLPLLLARERDSLVFHAGSVATQDGHRAILFLGPSGSGKSSTSLACVTAGASLLGDDFVLVRMNESRPMVWPSSLGVRLSPAAVDVLAPSAVGARSARVEKLRVNMGSQSNPVPLHALVFLGPRLALASAPAITPLRATDAYIRLVANSFHVGSSEPLGHEVQMNLLTQLVSGVPAFQLQVPDDLSALVQTCRTVLDLVATPEDGSL